MIDFVCPKCKEKLQEVEGKSKKCINGHTFDRAKQGYYNLLLGASKGVHGDNREMVEARRDFLGKDFYLPMAQKLSDLVLKYTEQSGSVLDCGCGEGYYTDIIEKKLFKRDNFSNVLGFDISKDAVKFCVKRNAHLSVAVASSYDMPIESATVDTVVNVFSPLANEEVLRVLTNGGHFIMVYPNVNHLWGLKTAIYKTPYKNAPEESKIDGFKFIERENVDYEIELKTKEEIHSLFMMTPYAYRTSKEDRERILSLDSLKTEISFCIDVYQKI